MQQRGADHLADDFHVIGDPHRLLSTICGWAHLNIDLPAGNYCLRRAHPAHEGLGPDAHARDIEATEITVLAPVDGKIRIEEIGTSHHIHCKNITQVTFHEELLDHAVHAQSHGRGDDLSGSVRVGTRRRPHLMCSTHVSGHARLAHHVLICFQRGDRSVSVHVGPRANDYRIDVQIGDDIGPRSVGFGADQLIGSALLRFNTAITDADDLHILLGRRPRMYLTRELLPAPMIATRIKVSDMGSSCGQEN